MKGAFKVPWNKNFGPNMRAIDAASGRGDISPSFESKQEKVRKNNPMD
jgi:hypothetical protein